MVEDISGAKIKKTGTSVKKYKRNKVFREYFVHGQAAILDIYSSNKQSIK